MNYKAGRVFSGNVLFIGLSILALLFFYSGNADAFSNYYVDRGCAGCHGATPTTCDGCHHHGSSGLQAATDKGTYTPGEALGVNFDGGSQTGWIRAILYLDNVEVARFAGTGNPPQGRSGTNSGFPITFTTTAPTTPGTYTYEAAWFGNSIDNGLSSTPPHGEVRVSTNSFTVTAGTDTTPPTVSSTLPDNNATGVPLGSAVTATFNEAIDPATVTTASFLLQAGLDNVAGAVALNGGGTIATFTPSAALADNTTYTATLTTAITDNAANPLAAAYVWTFTTIAVADTTAPTITTASTLSAGKVGTAYNLQLEATGGTPPYSWSVSAGGLPAGLSLSTAGVLSGTPTTAGTFSFTVQVTGGGTSTKDFDLRIDAAGFVFGSLFGGGDGGSGCAISPSGGGNGGILGTYGPLILLALGMAVRKRVRGRKE